MTNENIDRYSSYRQIGSCYKIALIYYVAICKHLFQSMCNETDFSISHIMKVCIIVVKLHMRENNPTFQGKRNNSCVNCISGGNYLLLLEKFGNIQVTHIEF